MYHDVHPGDAERYGRLGRSTSMYHLSESAFREHLRLIVASGITVLDYLGVERCLSGIRRGRAPDQPALAITFDDGWSGAFSRAAPLLAAEGIPAFFFITTGFVGRPLFASVADIKGLDPELFTVGSHSVSHRMLSELGDAEIRDELGDSKHWLEDTLGQPVNCLSLPGGATSVRLIAIARELGYSSIWTSEIKVNPTELGAHGIARLPVKRSAGRETFRRWLRFDLKRDRGKAALLSGPKKLLGMRRYSNLRRTILGESRGYDHIFQP